MRVLSLFALAAPLVSAIQFTTPATNSTLKKGETVSVKWGSVDTDPTTFSLFLVNFVDWPPFYTQVASDVQTSDGEYEVTVPCDVNTSWGYQFNAINGTNVFIIHAQTSKFSVRDGACSGTGPILPPDSPSPETCEAVTVTETATVTVSPSCAALPPASKSATATTSAETEEPTDDSNTGTDAEESEPAEPTVTSPPSVEDVDSTSTGITSTVYSTRYVDMSEAGECDQSCVVA
ncbi:Ser-Thr-rich glycosyl-phosphatidyl-inositol-anchored membrane family-domain-containing protein [Chaetomidium leptoderma]|uniref:Ser-Thr-rich glycosyl-phosphatidyl-inositol-anchored membrane family-domain-containing protein n=1 Tax=Chaetomidium leptoderma TaxID=669021 RepID=A0AAN6VTI1_9PEZI|nr:Ser-Thr-rich glycosyl-phosphatidyl-inositol-anchored membrane family-domain-containing protein [Chaetomidium leptoderma]